jgi:hypothetical protein
MNSSASVNPDLVNLDMTASRARERENSPPPQNGGVSGTLRSLQALPASQLGASVSAAIETSASLDTLTADQTLSLVSLAVALLSTRMREWTNIPFETVCCQADPVEELNLMLEVMLTVDVQKRLPPGPWTAQKLFVLISSYVPQSMEDFTRQWLDRVCGSAKHTLRCGSEHQLHKAEHAENESSVSIRPPVLDASRSATGYVEVQITNFTLPSRDSSNPRIWRHITRCLRRKHCNLKDFLANSRIQSPKTAGICELERHWSGLLIPANEQSARYEQQRNSTRRRVEVPTRQLLIAMASLRNSHLLQEKLVAKVQQRSTTCSTREQVVPMFQDETPKQ